VAHGGQLTRQLLSYARRQMLQPMPGPIEEGMAKLGLDLDWGEARDVVSRLGFVSDGAPDTPRRLRFVAAAALSRLV
jgi:hypothetical protein